MRKRESADSCTTILVGKNASYDGSTIVHDVHSADPETQ